MALPARILAQESQPGRRLERAKEIFRQEAAAIAALEQSIGADFEQAVEILLKMREASWSPESARLV